MPASRRLNDAIDHGKQKHVDFAKKPAEASESRAINDHNLCSAWMPFNYVNK